MKRGLLLLLVATVLLLSACKDPPTDGHFPLRLAHSDLDCAACHSAQPMGETPELCQGCHEDARPVGHYDGDCESCHAEDDWENGNFDHRIFFPVPHEGVRDCVSCHLDTPDYSTFSCIDCHAHRQSEMDDEHRGNPNYSYDSNECLRCHPRGDD